MSASAACELLPGGCGRLRFLVRTHGGHRVEGIGNSDYPCSEGYVIVLQAPRVARPVPAFMVFAYGICPRAEPIAHGPEHLPADLGVLVDNMSFGIVERGVLVEDMCRYG